MKEGSVFQIAEANGKSRGNGNGYLIPCSGKLFLALDKTLLHALQIEQINISFPFSTSYFLPL